MPIAGAPRRVTAPPDGPARPKTLALLLKGGASAASRSTAALDENRKLYRPAIRVSLPHECDTLAVEVLSDSRRSWTVYRCPARPRSPDRAQVLDARKSAAVSASSRPAPPPLGRAARPHRPAPARRTALRPARLTCRRRGGETLPFMGTEESAGSWAGLGRRPLRKRVGSPRRRPLCRATGYLVRAPTAAYERGDPVSGARRRSASVRSRPSRVWSDGDDPLDRRGSTSSRHWPIAV